VCFIESQDWLPHPIPSKLPTVNTNSENDDEEDDTHTTGSITPCDEDTEDSVNPDPIPQELDMEV